MRRLYQKIYLTIVASLVLVLLVATVLWRLGAGGPEGGILEIAGELVATVLPPAKAPPAEQAEAVRALADRLGTDLALFDSGRRLIASAGRPLPPPRREGSGWVGGPVHSAWAISLPDGRIVVAAAPKLHRNPLLGLVLFLGGIIVAVGVAAYPVARGLTRRLERLQRGVETLGAGALGTRVDIAGRDEIARLADSFNRAAERIEELVAAHRLLLASASHELRTPLARIRLGFELMKQRADPSAASSRDGVPPGAEIERDIAELDQLIDEILLASRLDAIPSLETIEEVDLLALVAEECAHYDNVALDGDIVILRGDPRLLRRLVRNLLDNAARHGIPPVSVSVRRAGDHAVLEVIDAGPGIPEAERERVFAPFYRLAGTAGSKGAGLGLSIVRRIARLHGGEATAAEADRRGFRVTLAVTTGPAGASG